MRCERYVAKQSNSPLRTVTHLIRMPTAGLELVGRG